MSIRGGVAGTRVSEVDEEGIEIRRRRVFVNEAASSLRVSLRGLVDCGS